MVKCVINSTPFDKSLSECIQFTHKIIKIPHCVVIFEIVLGLSSLICFIVLCTNYMLLCLFPRIFLFPVHLVYLLLVVLQSVINNFTWTTRKTPEPLWYKESYPKRGISKNKLHEKPSVKTSIYYILTL